MKHRCSLIATLIVLVAMFGSNAIGQQSSKTVTGNVTASGSTCTATNCVSSIANVGTSSASIKVKELPGTLTFSATIQFEVSLEGTDWYSIKGTPLSGSSASSATASGVWRFALGPFRWVRARCSAFTSGIIATTIETSTATANSVTSPSIYGLNVGAQVYMGTVVAGVTDTSDITVMPAVTSTYNWPTVIKIVNTSSTGTYGYICNGTCGTAANRVDYFYAPPGASYSNVTPFRSTVGTAVCIAAASGVTTLYASARGYTEVY